MAEPAHKPACRPTAEQLSASRREEILTQAALLFARHGYSNTNTALLADTVGVGKGTLYRYFPSKRELFLAAADRVMRMMRERIDHRVAGVEEPLRRVTLAIYSFLEFFAENPEFVELLIQERALFKDRTQPTFIAHRKMNVERWQLIYQDLIAVGRIRDVPVSRITDVLGNLLYGTIFTNYFAGQTKSVEEQAQDILDVVFRGLLTPPELRDGSASQRDLAPPH